MKAVHAYLIGTILAAAAGLALLYTVAYRHKDFRPAQPLPFEHSTHTAEEKLHMPCLACHANAEKHAGAGMPDARRCMDCHRHILAEDPRLAPLHAAADPDSPLYSGEPLRWRRANALPAYAHFNHSAHARKGFACERCHPEPGRSADHRMQSCLDCHRQEKADTDCSACHH